MDKYAIKQGEKFLWGKWKYWSYAYQFTDEEIKESYKLAKVNKTGKLCGKRYLSYYK